MYVGMHADQRLISGIFLPTFYFETGCCIELGAHWLPTLTDELQRSICLRPQYLDHRMCHQRRLFTWLWGCGRGLQLGSPCLYSRHFAHSYLPSQVNLFLKAK